MSSSHHHPDADQEAEWEVFEEKTEAVHNAIVANIRQHGMSAEDRDKVFTCIEAHADALTQSSSGSLKRESCLEMLRRRTVLLTEITDEEIQNVAVALLCRQRLINDQVESHLSSMNDTDENKTIAREEHTKQLTEDLNNVIKELFTV
jgi:hypothetical protein